MQQYALLLVLRSLLYLWMLLKGRPCVCTDGAARHDLGRASERRCKEGALAPPAAVDILTTLDDVRAAVRRGSTCIVRRIGSAASAGPDRHCSALRKGAEQCNQTQRKVMQCGYVLAVTGGGNVLL
jgi:hypothetical protein